MLLQSLFFFFFKLNIDRNKTGCFLKRNFPNNKKKCKKIFLNYITSKISVFHYFLTERREKDISTFDFNDFTLCNSYIMLTFTSVGLNSTLNWKHLYHSFSSKNWPGPVKSMSWKISYDFYTRCFDQIFHNKIRFTWISTIVKPKCVQGEEVITDRQTHTIQTHCRNFFFIYLKNFANTVVNYPLCRTVLECSDFQRTQNSSF